MASLVKSFSRNPATSQNWHLPNIPCGVRTWLHSLGCLDASMISAGVSIHDSTEPTFSMSAGSIPDSTSWTQARCRTISAFSTSVNSTIVQQPQSVHLSPWFTLSPVSTNVLTAYLTIG